MPIDLEALIKAVGLIGLFAIVFAETGLFFGFFLPGDSLLVTAGLVAQRGDLDLATLIVVLVLAAVTGDATGYAIGRRAGPRLFQREDSRFFKRSNLLRAEAFYKNHGGKTIVLARFMPFVRTFAPSVAGAARMSYQTFALYNIAGGAAWVVSMTLLGYLLGEATPNVDMLLLPILGLIVLLSVAPPALHLWRERRAAARSVDLDR
ncbi:MAG: DedA family protein [Dehalococcoidia bacterium]|nr:DedA family protein [Dehalococcoidia bacterium]